MKTFLLIVSLANGWGSDLQSTAVNTQQVFASRAECVAAGEAAKSEAAKPYASRYTCVRGDWSRVNSR